MNVFQAGALVANSLQQVLQKSVSEAGPVLSGLWGSKSKVTENVGTNSESSWSPIYGARSKLGESLSTIQRRNSDANEKKNAEIALKLLQSQVSLLSSTHW